MGTKRTSRYRSAMSAIGGKADIAANLLTKDEARRIAANIAKLPKDYGLSAPGAGVAWVGRDVVFNTHLVF